ncbi:uncharacterized protein A4U43_C02F3830 [Asparagus officinalis]|uniref:Plant specific eukaryotic initiation factor 4B n=1 Tax=Asparagus officinalis TaxID=4686 RepID=A0A5P1FKH3_ASPOF|nr:eukaryotic translation initiation factor 4B2-like [Asparagus officinalis]ONK77171.1 uncharacterized protein A4U43_C02F3830 [Asparagus officinalis]
MPLRADKADNWAVGEKASSFGQGPGRQDDRYGSLGSGSSSKADEVDSWFSNKKPVVSGPPAPSRHSGFGSGFRESAAGSSDSDRWVRGGGGGGGGGGMMMSNVGDRDVRERPRLVLDPPKGETSTEMSKTTRASPFGAARPREEVLAEKGVDWKKMESEIEVKKTSRPTSPHSSRPSSAQSSRPGSSGSQVAGGDGGAKIRAKVNPFGDARPREVLLEEKGRDWRKMDSQLEQRRVDRPETEEEKLLKDEINNLKKALTEETEGNMNGDSEQITSEKQTDLHEQISQREKDLDKLARELDDKVRFGQKATGSGASRIAFPSDRPPSQSGMSEDSKNVDYMERPRSHGGTGESWGKPLDERKGFQGGRESGFFGNRSMDRSRRDGW